MIKNIPPTITIGIPAFNEEQTIGHLLQSLMSQIQKGFIIEKVIVINDASTDKTTTIVKRFTNRKIVLIDDHRRFGKPERINQIFKKAQSDIVIILDADIKLSSAFIITELLKPFLKNKNIHLISGNSQPSRPTNFIQKVAYSGVKLWHLARSISPNSQMYFCEGPIRAFRKRLYREMVFPGASADDAFSYIYNAQKGYDFAYAKEALVYYSLPSTFNDYLKQYFRIIHSQEIQEKNFDTAVSKFYYTIRLKIKLLALIKRIIADPFWTSAYIFVSTLPKIRYLYKKDSRQSVWESVISTKKI